MAAAAKTPDLQTRTFATPAKWLAWLDKRHAKSPGLWLKFAKKASGIPSVTYPEALEIALCYGWIDGQLKSIDENYYLQRFTPRRPRSIWSKNNCAKVAALIASGRMQPAGLRQIEAAKADGRWDNAYDSPRTITMSDDLRRALSLNAAARKRFETLKSAERYAVLVRTQLVTRAEARKVRIQSLVELLASGKPLFPKSGFKSRKRSAARRKGG